MRAGDFFRVHDGPRSWSFGRCRRHDDEWLEVTIFGKGEPRFGWEPINYTTIYPLSLSQNAADRFLAVAEVWP